MVGLPVSALSLPPRLKGLGSVNFAHENVQVCGADPPPRYHPVIPIINPLVTAR